MSEKYSLSQDSFADEEIDAAIGVLKSGFYTMGEQVQLFEKELAEWTGAKEAIMVNSGSSANLLLVDALIRRTNQSEEKLKPGDEVLVPALSWPTTVWPIVQLGLVPVIVDVDPETLAIDLNSCEEVLSEKTKGMFLIHVMGQSAPMNEYVEFCKKHNIALIEDCCESFGSYFDEKHVGLFGHGGTLSHFFSHQLTTIEGGTILTNDEDLACDLRSMRAHGWLRDRADKDEWRAKYPELDPRFFFVMPGYNVRPMELQAAIGRVQLKKMDTFLDSRRDVACKVTELVREYCPSLEVIGGDLSLNSFKNRSSRSHSWMNICFRLKDSSQKLSDVMGQLESKGVETRAIIAGNLAKHPAFERINHRLAPSTKVSDELMQRGFMIGCHPLTSDKAIETLEAAFKSLGK